MIKRTYLFSFTFDPDKDGNTVHQFHVTHTSWFSDFPAVWDYAINHAKEFNDVPVVQCTMCVKV